MNHQEGVKTSITPSKGSVHIIDVREFVYYYLSNTGEIVLLSIVFCTEVDTVHQNLSQEQLSLINTKRPITFDKVHTTIHTIHTTHFPEVQLTPTEVYHT